MYSGRSLVRLRRRTTGQPGKNFGKLSQLPWGKQCSANTVYYAGGELLTSSGECWSVEGKYQGAPTYFFHTFQSKSH